MNQTDISCLILIPLCSRSYGTNLYLNAKLHRKQKSPVSYLLYDEAAKTLEGEINRTQPNSAERRELLVILEECYQKLWVEANLQEKSLKSIQEGKPIFSFPNLRTVQLPYHSPYYLMRLCETARELGAFNGE